MDEKEPKIDMYASTEDYMIHVPVDRILKLLAKCEDLTKSRSAIEGGHWHDIVHHCIDTLNEEIIILEAELNDCRDQETTIDPE